MVRRLVCIAAGVLFLGAFTTTPALAQVPGYAPGPSITLCSTTVFVGEPVTITGMNFTAGESVTAAVMSDPITVGTATVGGNGSFTLTFTAPNVAPGTHTVTVRGSTGDLASATFTVAAQPVVRPCFPSTPVTTPLAPDVAPPSAAPPNAAAPSAAVTPSAPSSGLAFTGTEIGLMAAAGAVLLVVGGMLVLTTRKRRSTAGS